MKDSRADLQSRWTTETTDAVRSCLQHNSSLSEVGVGRTSDGRWDLRGLNLGKSSPVESRKSIDVLQTIELSSLELASVDFSHATLPHLRLVDCVVKDCVFEGTDLLDLRLWTTTISGTLFSRSRLQDAALGSWDEQSARGVTFEACQFVRIDFSGVGCPAGHFVDCRFEDAVVVDLQFQATAFLRCSFSGIYTDVVWDGRVALTDRYPGFGPVNRMQECDFSRAQFNGVEMVSIDTCALVLPRDDADLLILDDFKRVVTEAFRLAEDSPANDLLMKAARSRLGDVVDDAPESGQNFIDMHIYNGTPAHGAKDVIRSLCRRAQARLS